MYRKCPKWTRLGDREMTNPPLMCVCECVCTCANTFIWMTCTLHGKTHSWQMNTHKHTRCSPWTYSHLQEKFLYRSKCWNYTLSWHHVRRLNPPPPKCQLCIMQTQVLIQENACNNSRLIVFTHSLPVVIANNSCITCAGIVHYLLGD